MPGVPAFTLARAPYLARLFQMVGQGAADEQPQRLQRQCGAFLEMHRAIAFIVEFIREQAAEVRDECRLAMGVEGEAALFWQAKPDGRA